MLNTFRIPGEGPPVLLVHGISDSSDSWLVLGPECSLAFLLADAGFDVWLFNARGNRYCKTNVKGVSKKTFWDFSFEEIGMYDVPANIDYILNKTGRPTLTYIGFSQGTTTFLTACSLRPEYNRKINYAILLAPVAWLNNAENPLLNFYALNFNNLKELSRSAKLYEVFAYDRNIGYYVSAVCNNSSRLKVLCNLFLYLSFGLKNLSALSQDRLPVITSHIPAGATAKAFFHFLQMYVNKRFERYDYGPELNRIRYSANKPPEYDLSQITVPIALFISDADWFSSVKDAINLRKKINSIDKFIVINRTLEFTHLEFVYGSRVNSIINKPVIEMLTRLKLDHRLDSY
ncbi:unnamed protein product [Leptidea sinapis]|uniref:AB hydrolase-1 domain-containing protein n=1 Tax=Leptidea sinapis TaxID=189913 RepID=A0A5E4QZB3_9NEOP|nr:unnamed protein product [Leptidea sinapis]